MKITYIFSRREKYKSNKRKEEENNVNNNKKYKTANKHKVDEHTKMRISTAQLMKDDFRSKHGYVSHEAPFFILENGFC